MTSYIIYIIYTYHIYHIYISHQSELLISNIETEFFQAAFVEFFLKFYQCSEQFARKKRKRYTDNLIALDE